MDTNYCKEGKCSRCGQCCTPFLPISKAELKKVEKYLLQHPEINKEAIVNLKIENNTIDITCCFHKDNKCLIYDVRPWICKAYKCDMTKEEMEHNRNYATNKAKYNTKDPSTLNDFRNLLYGDATLIIAGIMHFTNVRDKENLYKIVKSLGRKDLMKYIEEMQ